MFKLSFRSYSLAILFGITGGLFGCGASKKKSGGGYAVVDGQATGCIQGIVSNPLSGELVSLSGARMWTFFNNVIYDDLRVLADHVPEAKKADALGKYQLCGIPNAGIQLPVFLAVDGYQTSNQRISISNRTPDRNPDSAEPGYWVTPTVVANFSIYKLSDLAVDFAVTVTNKGAVVADANVVMSLNTSDLGNSVSAVTDASGIATFKATDLAFGQSYNVFVYPKDQVAADGSYISVATSTVTVGTAVSANAGSGLIATGPFALSYDLAKATNSGTSAPKLVSMTTANSIVADGTVTLVFDRDVEVDSASLLIATSQVATSSFGMKTDIAACTAVDLGSPVVKATGSNFTATISGNTVKLAPSWTKAPTLTTCSGVQLNFTISGIKVYAKGTTVANSTSVGSNVTIYLNAPKVQG